MNGPFSFSSLFDSSCPRILVADDDRMQRKLLQVVLKNISFEAEDGHSALAVAFATRPEVIILDRNLPDISGIEVIEELKNHPWTRSCAVIFLSAHDSPEDQKKGLDAGAFAYVSKAKVTSELTSRINEALGFTRTHPEANPLTLLPGAAELKACLDRRMAHREAFSIIHSWRPDLVQWTQQQGWNACSRLIRKNACTSYQRICSVEGGFLAHLPGDHFWAVLNGEAQAIAEGLECTASDLKSQTMIFEVNERLSWKKLDEFITLRTQTTQEPGISWHRYP